jgi:hypothetical protein
MIAWQTCRLRERQDVRHQEQRSVPIGAAAAALQPAIRKGP